MADAEFVFQIYLDKPVGIGEHPGLLEEMDAALTKWGDAQDKLAALATLTMEIEDAEKEPTLFEAWTKQKWRTKSGKPSTQGPKATGERYLPEKAIKALSVEGVRCYHKRKSVRPRRPVSRWRSNRRR